jgi:acetyltransferase-like isoleucine patch superfamily enzyme
MCHISVLRTAYFNFHYFPFSTAIKLPVIVYRGVKLRGTGGKIILAGKRVTTGMVHLGKRTYGFQHRFDVTIWEQHSGTVVFEEKVAIGKGTFISVGEDAVLHFCRNTRFGGDDRIMCMKSITIGADTIAAWDVTITDTDFRPTVNTIFNTRNVEKKAIVIGEENWLCFGCTILKGAVTPNACIVGANTTISKDYGNAGENIVIGHANEAQVTIRNIKYDTTFRKEEP